MRRAAGTLHTPREEAVEQEGEAEKRPTGAPAKAGAATQAGAMVNEVGWRTRAKTNSTPRTTANKTGGKKQTTRAVMPQARPTMGWMQRGGMTLTRTMQVGGTGRFRALTRRLPTFHLLHELAGATCLLLSPQGPPWTEARGAARPVCRAEERAERVERSVTANELVGPRAACGAPRFPRDTGQARLLSSNKM